jgi:YD repeat-containing protein
MAASGTCLRAERLVTLGNRDDTVLDSVTEDRVHNSVNELTQRTIGQGSAIDLTYDDAGNLTQDESANGDHKYVWDYGNGLIEAKEKQAGVGPHPVHASPRAAHHLWD